MPMPEPAPAFILKFDDPAPVSSLEVVRQLSHELRQPLSAIESIAYYLQMVLPRDDSPAREHLDKLPALVEQINWMLSDALHFFRATPCEPRILDLHELVSEAIAERAFDGPPHFEVEIPDTPALVNLDGTQGRHLFRSLISMLRNIDGAPARIFVRSRVESDRINLEFFLPGVDYTPEELQRMFEPFSLGAPEGLGLTLPTARKILEAHGGRISAKSETGLGTSLTGALPLAV
jgi:signal transduction histidine kinase